MIDGSITSTKKLATEWFLNYDQFPGLSTGYRFAMLVGAHGSGAVPNPRKDEIVMPWYYAQNNQRFGPYTDQEFSNIVAQGTVAPDTLVWRDGMKDWVPYSQAQPQSGSMIAAAPGPVAGTSDKPMVVCSSCHRAFPEDEVIQYQGAYVCAACKPVFVQRLREGATMVGEMRYAGFWIRFAAYFLDGIILGIFNMILGFIIGLGAASTGDESGVALGLQVVLNLIGIVIGVTYFTFFNGRFGATPGKMACGLTIVTAEGQPITYLRAFARYWATLLSTLTLLIGFIIAAFDDQKRALHDHICSTRVIRK